MFRRLAALSVLAFSFALVSVASFGDLASGQDTPKATSKGTAKGTAKGTRKGKMPPPVEKTTDK